MFTKQDQLYQNKEHKDLTKEEKIKYFTWIKKNKGCIICGKYPEIHHVTHKSIKGKRRLDTRVVPLCFSHHSAQSEDISIHGNPIEFYSMVSVEKLVVRANKMYQEYLDENY